MSGLLSFVVGHFPSERCSDAEPPMHLHKHAETIPICYVLGAYEPDHRRITVFDKSVSCVARWLNTAPAQLRMLVRLHEWSHALIHLGTSQDQRKSILDGSVHPAAFTASCKACFDRIHPDSHEQLAQLLTFHALQSMHATSSTVEARAAIEQLCKLFWELSKRQPPAYQIKELVNAPKHRVIESIPMLRQGAVADMATWRRIIAW
jgi:hypothetical protein